MIYNVFVGDVRLEAVGHGDGTWYIGATRVSTDECLSAATHRCSDFQAGQLFGQEVAMWRLAHEKGKI